MTANHLEHTLASTIRAAIQAADGQLPFDQFMELALYAPGTGYYVNGNQKLGATGDFVTAPELSPLFSGCLANQCAQILPHVAQGEILELGAGSGRMASAILQRLQTLDTLPTRYLILETSPDLQAMQRAWLTQTAPDLLPRIQWLSTLPEPGWRGIVLANEVLDAFPVHRVQFTGTDWQEGFVTWQTDQFQTVWGPIQSPGLTTAVQSIPTTHLNAGYHTELNLRLHPWLTAMTTCIAQGALLFIDYGYTAAEYYHPERAAGTLMCYHQHQAYTNPYVKLGQQDITAHVNFSALAHHALDKGLTLSGFNTQAHFLLANGLDDLLQDALANTPDNALALIAAVKQLTLPTMMGERFKVIGFNQQLDVTWSGFNLQNQAVYL